MQNAPAQQNSQYPPTDLASKKVKGQNKRDPAATM